MRSSRPLFHFEAGWLFIIAGLSLCVPGVLIPAQHDLHLLHTQRDELRQREMHNNARLRAHVDLLDQLNAGNADLTVRLVASQLNLLPADHTPVLLAANPTDAVTDWLEAVAAVDATLPSPEWRDSTLSRLAMGPRRLWLLGAGILCVFLGLITGGSFATRQR